MTGVLGVALKSPTPQHVIAYYHTPAAIGRYVMAEHEISGSRRKVVGLVSNSSYEPLVESPLFDVLKDPQGYRSPAPTKSTITIYVIADLSSGSPESPRYPVPPYTPFREAPPEVLRALYPQPGRGFIKIGSLAEHAGIEIGLKVDEMARHFLIAGATGSGKSNTVAVIADRLSAMGAPVVIFDVHGEYRDLGTEDGTRRAVSHEAKINPLEIPLNILARMIVPEPGATRQRRLLRRAIRLLKERVERKEEDEGVGPVKAVEMLYEESSRRQASAGLRGGDQEAAEKDMSREDMLKELLIQEIERYRDRDKGFKGDVINSVEDKVEEFFESSPVSLEEASVVEHIEPGKILVVDVSALSDEGKAWILRLYSDQILEFVKQRNLSNRPFPTVLVVEEAPLFLSHDSSSPAKESLRRLAREGRKFGAVLGVVSQRPRSLDVNVVSQLQNFVFLKMVQEEDIRAVMNIADAMDEALARIIPSLPKGRAVVMGEWAGRFPVLVDIDQHRGKRRGETPHLADLWGRLKAEGAARAPAEDERFEVGL